MTNVEVKSDEDWVRDADGNVLRECDDVVLLTFTEAVGKGNCSELPRVIQEGTRATIIIIAPDDELVELECYVAPGKFAFARERGSHLRLLRRREEKLEHAGH